MAYDKTLPKNPNIHLLRYHCQNCFLHCSSLPEKCGLFFLFQGKSLVHAVFVFLMSFTYLFKNTKKET